MLKAKDLKKKFGDKIVIDTTEFFIDSGIYWLKGPNGSGKTTLLRMIAGLLHFDGDILIDGVSQKRSPLAYRRLVSWADAEPLYPGFITGNDLVRLYLDIRKVEQNKIDLLIETFQVGHFLNAPLGTYSSGMLKKLSLLLAFIGEPRLILLDEPLITLDKDSVPRVCELIRDLHRNKNIGFIISSHQDFIEGGFRVEKRLLIVDQNIQSLA